MSDQARWVPVAERPPGEGWCGYVLRGGVVVGTDSFYDNGFGRDLLLEVFEDEGSRDKKTTHWLEMEIPPPP